MLCPASTPTASPGAASARRNLSSISRAKPSAERGACSLAAAASAAAAFFLCRHAHTSSQCYTHLFSKKQATALFPFGSHAVKRLK